MKRQPNNLLYVILTKPQVVIQNMKIRREYNNGISQMYTDFTRQRSTLSNRFNNLIYQHNFKRRHTNSQTSQLVKSSISCESNNKIMNEKLDEPNKNISYTPLTAVLMSKLYFILSLLELQIDS